jgi:hypothetical protein
VNRLLPSVELVISKMSVNISAPNRVRLPIDDPFESDPKLLALDAKGYILLWSVLDCVRKRGHPSPEALFL